MREPDAVGFGSNGVCEQPKIIRGGVGGVGGANEFALVLVRSSAHFYCSVGLGTST